MVHHLHQPITVRVRVLYDYQAIISPRLPVPPLRRSVPVRVSHVYVRRHISRKTPPKRSVLCTALAGPFALLALDSVKPVASYRRAIQAAAACVKVYALSCA